MKDKYQKCSEDIKTVLKKSIDSTLKIGRLLNDLKIQEKDKNRLSPKYLKMFDELGTPSELKVKKAFPEAGDHVITSYLSSNNYVQVTEAVQNFLKKIL